MFIQEEKFLLNQYLEDAEEKLTQNDLIYTISNTKTENKEIKDLLFSLLNKIRSLNEEDYKKLCLCIPFELEFDTEQEDFHEIDSI